MTEETRIALKNYDWLLRNRGFDVILCWENQTLIVKDGGIDIDGLLVQGLTPAT
jgi:hypothetical protein